ncbi:DUF3616 domain-containing protein [Sphingomonas sp. 1P06PA]|uniref:DUF3616 domain-containing protein n=1 Tax=Sphingomonas sp. 1P06PA TaxID=554121 RepID=UPI0039A48F62
MTGGWPDPARPSGHILLDFDLPGGDATMHDLSAATRIGLSLFVAGDEAAAIERLGPVAGDRWAGQLRYQLRDLLDLADPDAEVDIEGLAADDGWLWIVGSHARTRRKPEKQDDETIDLGVLADLRDTRPRCVLARVPLIADPAAPGALIPVAQDGMRRAGMIRQTKRGSALAEAFAADPLIGPFTRVPAKEGGLDVEGIAVAGDRVALGLRGPVIGGHALLVELRIAVTAKGRLKLAAPPVKRLLAMEGLGIRDLKRCDRDLLILAGPTTGLSGPVAIYRWRDWLLDAGSDADSVRLHRPERILELPHGRGVDHPEGLALWDDDRLLILCDSPAPARIAKGGFRADLFDLPG